mmetsp:Transcript_19713/g.53223  ORF Transcript_19713/g.53223 Transcript_19713/m.53223 type:complete len:120 (+) Transcript_19713:221-580(+)
MSRHVGAHANVKMPNTQARAQVATLGSTQEPESRVQMRSMMCPDPIASPPRARHSLRTSVDIESRARLIHEACYFNGSLSPKRAVQTPSGEVSEAETDAFPAFDGTLGIEQVSIRNSPS